MSLKQKKIQFKARIKLNNNMLASNWQAQPKKKTMSRLCGVQSPNGCK